MATDAYLECCEFIQHTQIMFPSIHDFLPHVRIINASRIAGLDIARVAFGPGTAPTTKRAVIADPAMIAPIFPIAQDRFQGLVPDVGKWGFAKVPNRPGRHIHTRIHVTIGLNGAITAMGPAPTQVLGDHPSLLAPARAAMPHRHHTVGVSKHQAGAPELRSRRHDADSSLIERLLQQLEQVLALGR